MRSLLKESNSAHITVSKTIEGIYRNRKIELNAMTPNDGSVCHARRCIYPYTDFLWIYRNMALTKRTAAVLRDRLACFAEDWESPEMNVYDNYDEEKDILQTLCSKVRVI